MKTKRFILLFLVAACWVTLSAGSHNLEVGACGGAAWWMANGKSFKNTPGAAGGLQIGYAVRGTVGTFSELGIKTGVAFGFASASHQLSDYKEQYTNRDYYPEYVDYALSADAYRQRQQQWQAAIPLFLSLKTHGVVVNIGAKVTCLISQTRQLDVTNAHIVAYFPDLDVPVTDYLATGRLNGFQDRQTGKSNMPQWSVLLSAEVGYEWHLKNTSHIGVGIYADYGIWNNYTNQPSAQRLIDVAPIMDRKYPVPEIKVNYLTDTYSDKVNFLSVGVRLYYALSSQTSGRSKNRSYPCHCVNQ